MNAGTKVGGFLAGLVLVGAVGAGVGAVVGPVDTEPADHDGGTAHDAGTGTGSGPTHDAGHDDAGHDDTGHDAGADEPAPAEDPHAGHGSATPGDAGEAADTAEAAGTSATQAGYRLALDPTDDEIRFRVLDPEGGAVVDTEVVHEKPLHLIVVGRDLVGYAHVHPEVDAAGTWSVARPDLAPGSYRVVADLQPAGGPELALAADLTVPGAVAPVAVPAPATTAEVEGITVTMDGHPQVGDTELSFTVDGGEPEPYLGARGHLVAFRADDLAYSHVHPHDGDAGPVAFRAGFPTPGTYRLFLDLKVGGEVRTFAFTVEVDDHEH